MPEEHPDQIRIKKCLAKAFEAAEYAAQCHDNSMLEGAGELIIAYAGMSNAFDI